MTIEANAINPNGLYSIRTISDPNAGTILWHIPMISCGIGELLTDTTRPEVFIGECVLHTNRGPVPFKFPIEASSIHEALQKFHGTLIAAVEAMQQQAMRQQIATAGGAIDLSKLNHNKKN